MKWFFFHIFVVMFSSIMEFLFVVILVAHPNMIIPNIPEIYVILALLAGMWLGVFLLIFSISALYKSGIKVKIQE